MLNVIGLAMVGLVYGLIHWIFYCSGARACPGWWSKKTKPDDIIPEQAIGAMGQLAAALGLLGMSAWLVILSGMTDSFLLTSLVVVGAIFGFLFLGMAIVAMKGWDWRPVGDAALIGAVTDFIFITCAANIGNGTGLPWDIALGFWIFGILAMSWGLVIHGKCSAKILQFNLIISLGAAWYFLIFYSGLLTVPAWVGDFQNSVGLINWSWIWGILGAVSIVMLLWTYRMGPKKAFVW
jgi:hypothetical protein